MKEEVERRYFVEAAAKILDVLESFASDTEELSITEIARRTNLTYSSAFRLIYTLEKRGHVMRRPGRKCYVLTPVRKQFRLGYAGLTTTSFQKEVTRGLVAAARKNAIALVLKQNDEFNVSKALLNADELLAAGVDLLIEYQFNETASHLIGSKCHSASIPAIALNFAQPGAYYFGGDSYLTGVLAGDFLSKFIKHHWKGRVDICVILPAKGLGSTQEARKTGLLDSLRRGLPSMQESKIHTADPALTARDGYALTKRMLGTLAQRNNLRIAVAALVDPLGIGAAACLKEAGVHDRSVVIGQGGAPDARAAIAKGGPFKASVAFFPEGYGERTLSLALRILGNKKVPLMSYTNHVVLTADNLKDYYPENAGALLSRKRWQSTRKRLRALS